MVVVTVPRFSGCDHSQGGYYRGGGTLGRGDCHISASPEPVTVQLVTQPGVPLGDASTKV